MFNISDTAQIVASISSLGVSNLISFIIVLFIAFIGSNVILEYMHNKHMEAISKDNAEVANMSMQHIEQMTSMAITSTQAMDITDSVLKAKNSKQENKQ